MVSSGGRGDGVRNGDRSGGRGDARGLGGGSPLFFYTPLCCHRLWLTPFCSQRAVVVAVHGE